MYIPLEIQNEVDGLKVQTSTLNGLKPFQILIFLTLLPVNPQTVTFIWLRIKGL